MHVLVEKLKVILQHSQSKQNVNISFTRHNSYFNKLGKREGVGKKEKN